MAHSNDSIITGKLRGSLGKELVFRNWEGKTIVAKAPGERKGEATVDQKETQDKFKLGSIFATNILKDEEMKEAYSRALKPRQNTYSRAMADFLFSPVVKKIDTQKYQGAIGDTISVSAFDDFRVVSVQVEIRDSNGTLLEQGAAVISKTGLSWLYTATAANGSLAGTVIKAIATDIPENEGILEVIV